VGIVGVLLALRSEDLNSFARIAMDAHDALDARGSNLRALVV